MTLSTRTWPANGGTAGSVVTSYGPRTVDQSRGGLIGDEVIKYVSIEITAPDKGIAAAAWAKNGLDVVIPTGSVFLTADLVVETAFDALTGLNIGTYAASDGTTAIDADGLAAAAACTLEMINAVGDRVKGAGAQLATGTAGIGATTAASVIRTLYTGTVPTVGKARLIVSYVQPTA